MVKLEEVLRERKMLREAPVRSMMTVVALVVCIQGNGGQLILGEANQGWSGVFRAQWCGGVWFELGA